MESYLSCAMDIGQQMLISGAEVNRVEESVRRMCSAFGYVRTDVFIITSCMIASVYTDDGRYYTQTRRIINHNTDFECLHRLNDLSREICQNSFTVEEIQAKLDKSVNSPKYPLWLEGVFYAVIAGAFTLFFGGGLIEMLVSIFAGTLVRIAILFTDKTVSSKIFSKFISSVIVTAIAFAVLKIGWISDVDKVIIGNIMTLIPGVGLTNSLRDLFIGDSIAGLLRAIEAVLIALAIVAGYFLVVVLGGFAL